MTVSSILEPPAPTTLPRVRRVAALALLVLALVAAGCGNDDGSDEQAGAPGSTSEKQPAAQKGGCREVQAPAPKPDGGESKPKGELAAGSTYEVELQTSCGAFSIRLDQKTSPATSASFAALAKSGFFDGTVFHRIVPDFVIQGGDPTASGQGGPGYSTVDKPPPGTTYPRGVVAMAKTEAEAPGTAGSQFYVVTGAEAPLPPDYAVLGKVVKGLDVTQRIGRLGDPATEMPLQPVVVEKATLNEN